MGTAEVETVTRTRAWLIATRPMTVPVGFAPIVIGAGVAVYHGIFVLEIAIAAMIAMLLNQQGTHFVNDYYDGIRGIDTDDRKGFTRVTQSGLIPANHVKQGIWVVYGLTFLAGLYPVYVGGLPMAITGVFLAVVGFLYAGPPVYYADKGLGDLAIFFVFGVIPACATYYLMAVVEMGAGPFPLTVPAGTIPMEIIVASLAPAGLATAMMIINNTRDRDTDREAGKRTVPVRFGYRFARIEFISMLALAYLAPVILWLGFGFDMWVLLPLVSLPYAASVTQQVLTHTDEVLNRALTREGHLTTIFSILFLAGVTIPVVL